MRINNNSQITVAAWVAVILLVSLAASWDACRSGRARRLLDNLATPRSGENEVLPKEVGSLLGFLRESGAQSVRVSAKIAENRFVFQPLTEGAYPIRMTSNSRIFISYSSESLPGACTTLRLEKGIRIADCR